MNVSMVDAMSQTPAPDPPLFPFARAAGDPFTPPVGPGGDPSQPAVRKVVLPSGQWTWLVSGHEEVRRMLRSPAFSADPARRGFPQLQPVLPRSAQPSSWASASASREWAGMFIRMDGPDHTRLRRMVTPEFMIRNMRRLEPLVHRTVGAALDALGSAERPADLIERFALPVPSIVICHLLGVPYADHEFFQEHSRTLASHGGAPEDVRDAAQSLRAYLGDLVAAKQRAGGSDDLIGRLAVERVATGQLSADEVVGMALLLLVAGHETTAKMIGLSVLLLLDRYPAEYAALRTDPGRAATTVEELLRYLTVVRTGLPRAAVADVELGGQVIRAGEGAIALLSGANRDPGVLAGPGEFDAGRGSQQHLAFGYGVHQCIGQPLARVELRIGLVELAARFPRLALAVPLDEVPMCDDSMIYGVHRLPVTW
jgi:cytochrome P450